MHCCNEMEDLNFGPTSPFMKHEDEVHRSLQQPDDRDEEYEQFLADVWVGVVLTLMVVSCVCCVCSCLLYHKFQQWKRNVLEARAQSVESGNAAPVNDVESLPSYTLVSGLPTYDEALEQLRQSRAAISKEIEAQNNTSVPCHEPRTPAKLSASDLLHHYKNLTTV